jgi:hypothetical protein
VISFPVFRDFVVIFAMVEGMIRPEIEAITLPIPP